MYTIVVGAGIAGLWIADQLVARGDRVTVLEAADYIGGRILTSSAGLEIGAGRISTGHKRTLALLKRFGLQTHPIPDGESWKGLGDAHAQPNTFMDEWAPLMRLFAKMDDTTLATHTLRQLADKTLGPALTADILKRYEYRAETEVMRADIGIQGFAETHAPHFVTVKGGLSQLTTKLAAGLTIQQNTKVRDVTIHKDIYHVHTDIGTMPCERVILAIPSEALRRLPCMRAWKPLRHLKMEPLTRIYAKFATPWSLSSKLVTDSPLRFIIPILPQLGIVMISYTESQDTRSFRGLTGLVLAGAIQSELQRLFPTDTIPQILWVHAYEWTHGCTYWLPGDYDPVAASKEALQPFPKTAPHLHLCGESYSLRQAWVEGALDHAAALWGQLNHVS